jgi:hypothetical protein
MIISRSHAVDSADPLGLDDKVGPYKAFKEVRDGVKEWKEPVNATIKAYGDAMGANNAINGAGIQNDNLGVKGDQFDRADSWAPCDRGAEILKPAYDKCGEALKSGGEAAWEILKKTPPGKTV